MRVQAGTAVDTVDIRDTIGVRRGPESAGVAPHSAGPLAGR